MKRKLIRIDEEKCNGCGKRPEKQRKLHPLASRNDLTRWEDFRGMKYVSVFGSPHSETPKNEFAFRQGCVNLRN